MRDFAADAEGVTVTLSSGEAIRGKYLVGCDGAHSAIRKASGIGFPGSTSDDVVFRRAQAILPASSLSAITGSAAAVPDAAGAQGPLGYFRLERGTIALVNIMPGHYIVAVFEWDQPAPPDDEPVTFEEIRAAVERVVGAEVPMSPPSADESTFPMMRRTRSNTRVAERYRAGRVLIAGDAAHVHPSIGAPGLNLGLQDAANLGWKLAGAVHGWAPAGLLDTYETERRPVAERTAMQTQAQATLVQPGEGITAIRSVLGELIAEPGNARRIAALMAGSDIRYGTAEAGSPVGHFVPDFTLTVDGRETRLAELLRTGRPLLIGASEITAVAARWKDRVDLVTADRQGLLVRPDGYASWSGIDPAGLTEALCTWFGEPTAP
jgi:2-polyprenyl-6-methoxyphenol hydroxylase-like FAD-dependent oxidoreductase